MTCQSEGQTSDRQVWAKPACKGGVGRAQSPGGRGGSVELVLQKQAVWNTRLRGQSGTKKWEPQCPAKVPTTFSPDGFQGLELPWHESPRDSVMPSGAPEIQFPPTKSSPYGFLSRPCDKTSPPKGRKFVSDHSPGQKPNHGFGKWSTPCAPESLTPAGLEAAIFGSEVRRLIH